MLRSSLCDYSGGYILVKGAITVANTGTIAVPKNANKKVITNCINQINNAQVDEVISMYNLMEYRHNDSKSFGILCQYCMDDLLYMLLVKLLILNITGKTGNSGAKHVRIMVALKYLSNFWGTPEMYLVNCEINLNLNCSENCVIMSTSVADQGTTLSITDTRLYVPVLTLSTQDNAKLLEQLKSSFKRTINWNGYQSKVSAEG